MSGTPNSKLSMADGQSQQQQPQSQQSQLDSSTSSVPGRSPSCCDSISGSENSFFSLKWNEFDKQLSSGFSSLFHTQDFADVTLSCEGTQARAHKVVLAMCSPYFRSIFKENPCKHPVVIIKGIKFRDLQNVLRFIYFGQVSVVKNEIQDFIEAAELLKLDGISSDSSDHSPPHETASVRGSDSATESSTPLPSSTGATPTSTKDAPTRMVIKQEFSPTHRTNKYSPSELGMSTSAGSTRSTGSTPPGPGPGGIRLSPSMSSASRSYDSSPVSMHPFPTTDRDTPHHYPTSASASRSSKNVLARVSPSSESTGPHHQASVINHGRKKNYGASWTNPTVARNVPLHVTVPSATSTGKGSGMEDSSNQSETQDLSSPSASVRSKSSPADPLQIYPLRSMSCESNAPTYASLSGVAGSRSSSCDTNIDPLAIDPHHHQHQHHRHHHHHQQQQQQHLPVLINLEESAEESQDSLITESTAGQYELSIQTVESPYGHVKSFTTPSGMVVSTLHGHSLGHSSSSGMPATGPSGWVVGMGQLLKPSTITSAMASAQSMAGGKIGSSLSSGGGYRSSGGSSSLLHYPNGPMIPKLSTSTIGHDDHDSTSSSRSHLQGAVVPAIPAKKRFSHLGLRFQHYSDSGYGHDKSPMERQRHLAKLSGAAHTMTESSSASSAGSLALMMAGTTGGSGAVRESGGVLAGVPRFKNQRHSQVPQSARYTTAEVDAMVDSVTNHSGPFVPCKICDKLVKRERLRAHIHECHLVHGEKIICPHCGVGLKSKGSYRVHVWRHRRGVLAKGLKTKRVLGQRPRDTGPGSGAP